MKEKELLKYIVAFTMGDGYLSKPNSIKSNSYFKCSLKNKHIDLILLMKNILKNISNVKLYSELRNNNTIIRTSVSSLFTKVRTRLYNKHNNRIIDPHYLKLIDEEFLALLYMFDGSKTEYKRKTKSNYLIVKLSTHSYSYYDNLSLSNYIRDNFKINFKIQKEFDKRYGEHYYYLQCYQNEALKFLEITKPYKLKSFNYKWDVETTKEILLAKNKV